MKGSDERGPWIDTPVYPRLLWTRVTFGNIVTSHVHVQGGKVLESKI